MQPVCFSVFLERATDSILVQSMHSKKVSVIGPIPIAALREQQPGIFAGCFLENVSSCAVATYFGGAAS